MISFNTTEIKDVFVIDNFHSEDVRGTFVKTYNSEKLEEAGFDGIFRESYYSRSYKNVIRGMHFQTPPHDHEKLVYVTEGVIIDVVLDLRRNSNTFGRSISVKLTEFGRSVFIPKGCAHGFLTLSDTAIVVYMVSSVYNQSSDSGILWNSFGFDWGLTSPVLSERDKSFQAFTHFESPFL